MKNYTSRKFVLAAITALALVASALQAQAQNALVTFDLTQLQDNLATQTMTVSGITMTITTTSNWGSNTGAINVNNEGLMVYEHVNDAFSITFDKEVTYDGYTVGNDISGSLGGVTGRLTMLNSPPYDKEININIHTNNSAALTQGSHEFTDKINVDANETIWFTNNFGDLTTTPWRWTAFTVTAAVPEPASYALLLGFGAFLFIMIRHRIRR